MFKDFRTTGIAIFSLTLSGLAAATSAQACDDDGAANKQPPKFETVARESAPTITTARASLENAFKCFATNASQNSGYIRVEDPKGQVEKDLQSGTPFILEFRVTRAAITPRGAGDCVKWEDAPFEKIMEGGVPIVNIGKGTDDEGIALGASGPLTEALAKKGCALVKGFHVTGAPRLSSG